MKKTLIAFIATITFSSTFAQNNTLPTNGNVGIGTTSPTERLTVRGRVRIDSTLTVIDSVRIRKGLRVDENVYLMQDLRVGGNTQILGNLKVPNINTANNLSNKEVVFVNENGAMLKSGFPTLATQLYSLECLQLPDGTTMNPTWSNGPSKIFVACPNDARVGIGTNEPRSKLDVRGTTFTQKIAIGIHPDNMVGIFHLRTNSATNSNTMFLVESPSKKLLELTNQGLLTTERIYIKNTTTNTTGSDYVLQVENSTQKILQLQSNGLMRARKIRVDAETWADFVFEEDYKLMSTDELRTFITVNNHLPNVPSAKTVEEEGIDLAEMNKILLQKVEELTLYMLEQQKQIDELKKKSN